MTDLELNTAIAALLGVPNVHNWETTGQCNHYGSIYECDRCGDIELTDCIEVDGRHPCIPPYATDLNRAVAAGRTLGMFDYDVGIHVQDGRGSFNGAGVVHFWRDIDGDSTEHLAVDYDSAARAVCAAILKFTELKSSAKIHGDGDHAWLT